MSFVGVIQGFSGTIIFRCHDACRHQVGMIRVRFDDLVSCNSLRSVSMMSVEYMKIPMLRQVQHSPIAYFNLSRTDTVSGPQKGKSPYSSCWTNMLSERVRAIQIEQIF